MVIKKKAIVSKSGVVAMSKNPIKQYKVPIKPNSSIVLKNCSSDFQSKYFKSNMKSSFLPNSVYKNPVMASKIPTKVDKSNGKETSFWYTMLVNPMTKRSG